MTEKLVTTIEQRRSGARLIRLTGVLDEDNGLGDLIERVEAGTALINLSGVERINSSGARDWVHWLASLEAKGIRPLLVACSPAVVAQLNRIDSFAGHAVVKSFLVPYHCTTCDLEKQLLVNISDMGSAPYEAPPCVCDECASDMMFVEDPDLYFQFVAHVKSAPPEPKAEPEPQADLARGSTARISTEQMATISQPRLPQRGSRPSLSAFQLGEGKRPSEHEIIVPGRRSAMPSSDTPYLVAIIVLLFCVVGVLVYLLLG
jgi:anti-anti-sigma regulatory factor